MRRRPTWRAQLRAARHARQDYGPPHRPPVLRLRATQRCRHAPRVSASISHPAPSLSVFGVAPRPMQARTRREMVPVATRPPANESPSFVPSRCRRAATAPPLCSASLRKLSHAHRAASVISIAAGSTLASVSAYVCTGAFTSPLVRLVFPASALSARCPLRTLQVLQSSSPCRFAGPRNSGDGRMRDTFLACPLASYLLTLLQRKRNYNSMYYSIVVSPHYLTLLYYVIRQLLDYCLTP